MFKESNKGLLQSSIFSPNRIIHGFSLQEHDDMRGVSARKRFRELLDAITYRLIAVEQVHSGNVHEVQQEDFGKTVMRKDGLVLNQRRFTTRGLVMGIAADCVLALLADEENGVVAIFHAGWRGTLERIAAQTVEMMRKNGARTDKIKVAVGPSICQRCYDVPLVRARTFQRTIDKDVVVKIGEKWHVDLAFANILELKRAGVNPDNIDASSLCTFENPRLYSFRRERPNLSGEHVAMIGLR